MPLQNAARPPTESVKRPRGYCELASYRTPNSTPHQNRKDAKDVRLRRLATQIHALGPRPLYEFLAELDAGADLWTRLEAYAALERYCGFIAALDGDRMPPLRVVGGRR
jgi:hypothetical protein